MRHFSVRHPSLPIGARMARPSDRPLTPNVQYGMSVLRRAAYANPHAGSDPRRAGQRRPALATRRLLALNSYENRVYQVDLEDALAGRRRSSIGPHAGPTRRSSRSTPSSRNSPRARFLPSRRLSSRRPDAARFEGFRFAVYPQRGGRAPELDDPDDARVDRAASSGASTRSVRCSAVRRTVPRSTSQLRRRAARVPARPRLHAAGPARSVSDGVANRRWPACATAFDARRRCRDAAPARRLPCAAMCCGPTDGPHFVDFDDARIGPGRAGPVDAAVRRPRGDDAPAVATMLAGYEDFHDFDPRELHLVEALRTLRLIHYAAWIARRWDDPAFPPRSRGSTRQRYWQDRILELREQIAVDGRGAVDVLSRPRPALSPPATPPRCAVTSRNPTHAMHRERRAA